MTFDILSYLLGLLTIPLLAGLLFAVAWATTKNPVIVSLSLCPYCAELGWPEPIPEGDHRSNLAAFLNENVRHEFRARKHAHRVLWQAHYDEHPDWMPKGKAQKRYGLPATQSPEAAL
jgi:hypothetical protein